MAKIKLTIVNENAEAKVVEGCLAHGAVGVAIDVSVSGDIWAGVPYKVVCVCNGIAKAALVINGVATVPHECLIGGYVLNIGIDSGNQPGPLRIPTILASCGYVLRSTASVDAGESVPPTPDIYAQILEAIESGKIKGDDGYSPTVGVMTIDGGHRVTITDKQGEHSFDVMDGHDGDDYVLTDADKQQIASMISAYDDSEINEALSKKYEKPESGIPATDLAAGVIPEKLPVPNKLTFTGAATGEFDGSEPVTINIPSGGGGGGTWETLIDTTLTEVTDIVSVNVDSKIDKLMITMRLVPEDGNIGSKQIRTRFYLKSGESFPIDYPITWNMTRGHMFVYDIYPSYILSQAAINATNLDNPYGGGSASFQMFSKLSPPNFVNLYDSAVDRITFAGLNAENGARMGIGTKLIIAVRRR